MSSVHILYSNFHSLEKYNRIRSMRISQFYDLQIKSNSKWELSYWDYCFKKYEVRDTRKINPYLNPTIFNDLMSVSTQVEIGSSYLSSSSLMYILMWKLTPCQLRYGFINMEFKETYPFPLCSSDFQPSFYRNRRTSASARSLPIRTHLLVAE